MEFLPPMKPFNWSQIDHEYGEELEAAKREMHEKEGKRLVIIESPFAGNVSENIEYARAAVRDSLLRGEAPIASHLLYTQDGILNDDIPAERQHGIDAGLAWRAVAQASIIYTDKGISRGMECGIAAAKEAGIPVEYRSLAPKPE